MPLNFIIGNNVFWHPVKGSSSTIVFGSISKWTEVPMGYLKNCYEDFCSAPAQGNIFFHVYSGHLKSI